MTIQTTTQSPRLTISVIMPAYRASHLLAQVLTPLLAMRDAGEVDEVLVVDDQSPDDTAAVARAMGATVLVTPQNGGPGVARNLASKQAIGDILWFVDSDVIAQPGGPAHIRRAFSEPGVDAVFGSYDDDPGGKYWFSRYKNLLHRYHHQAARREARTFWAGCGAVRATAFAAVGGFDVETYRKPSIEDIELGYRISNAGGRILVEPDLLGKHLKVWTIRNALHTDIFCRALPWSRLIITREGLTDDLNTGKAERVRALIAGALLVSISAMLVFPSLWPLALGLAALAVLCNLKLARFFYNNGGLAFAAGSLLYHQVYYIYSASIFVWCLFEAHILGKKDRLHVR
jgi:glycosyltransferase involved in cell wall biosynthesis